MNPAALSSPARYLIVDDEPRLAERLAQRLAVAWPEAACLGLWHDGLSASQAIDQLTPDVVFLDIRMPGLDGLLLAQSQLDKVQPPRIVFVTAYQEHALEAFGLAAVDYLCKPVDPLRLAATVKRLKALLGEPAVRSVDAMPAPPINPPLHYLRAGSGDTVTLIPTEDIVYLEAADKCERVLTATGEHWVRASLKTLHAQLDATHFCLIHRSVLVNLREVRAAHRDERGKWQLSLIARAELLPVSAQYVHLFKQM